MSLPVGLFNPVGPKWERTNYADPDAIISTGRVFTSFHPSINNVGAFATSCLSDPLGTEMLTAGVFAMGSYQNYIPMPTGSMFDSCRYIS